MELTKHRCVSILRTGLLALLAAQIALCSDEPSSHGTGSSGSPGSDLASWRRAKRRSDMGEVVGSG